MSSSTNRNPVTTGPTSRQQLVAHTLAGSWPSHFELWSGRGIKITRLLHLTHRNDCGYLDTDENASPLQMIYEWRRPTSSGRRGSRRRYFCLMTPDDLACFIVIWYMKQPVSAHWQPCETSMHSEIKQSVHRLIIKSSVISAIYPTQLTLTRLGPLGRSSSSLSPQHITPFTRHNGRDPFRPNRSDRPGFKAGFV